MQSTDDFTTVDGGVRQAPRGVGAAVGDGEELVPGAADEQVTAGRANRQHAGGGDFVLRADVDERDVLGSFGGRRGQGSAEKREDLVLFGEASDAVLREDQAIVLVDVEDPAVPADEFRFRAGRFLDPGRQTGGPRQVVSATAVVDRDRHGRGV